MGDMWRTLAGEGGWRAHGYATTGGGRRIDERREREGSSCGATEGEGERDEARGALAKTAPFRA